MPQRIDHLVIIVRDLDRAIASYTELGFTVVPGGSHSGGRSHNALVGFQDGSYFELFAFINPDQPLEGHQWWAALQRGGGLADCCFGGESLAEEVSAIAARGISYQPPYRMGRSRPDGQLLDWQLARTPAGYGCFLPFMIEDFTPRELRVPNGPDAVHPNGVTGIAELIIAVPDLDEAVGVYRAIFGGEPVSSGQRADIGGDTASFTLGTSTIVLAAPTGPDSPLAARLTSWGSAPYQAALSGRREDAGKSLDLALAQGARFTLV